MHAWRGVRPTNLPVSRWTMLLVRQYGCSLSMGFTFGCRLPFLVAPHVIRMLLNRKRRKTALQTMRPGVMLDTQRTPEPLLPYDRIRTLRSPEWNKAH